MTPVAPKHILDNPAWSALQTGNNQLALGTTPVAYFSPDVSPFVAVANNSPHALQQLYQQLPYAHPVVLISDEPIAFESPWKLLERVDGYQMLYTAAVAPIPPPVNLVPLTEAHIPQMLALTQLTRPGPFAEKTIAFGHYEGIFDGDQLVAMAGQRLHAEPYAEISAVCTHPDHLGKGYARLLILRQISRIQAANGIAYLHVRSDNERAIRVYESMGFETRKPIYFNVIVKE